MPWLQFSAGADLRLNSHDQVEDEWRLDLSDRGIRRPRLSLRRATATIAYRKLTVDLGKQFIRWGKTDILNPTDHFAPRDYLNVVDTEFLPVTGGRASLQATGQDSLEVVWLPRFTPSRIPLLDQRWTVSSPHRAARARLSTPAPSSRRVLRPVFAGATSAIAWSTRCRSSTDSITCPTSTQSVKPNTLLPEIDIVRQYPAIRSYGADLAHGPRRGSRSREKRRISPRRPPGTDEYVLYVIQVERQTGEWVLVGGYAGEAVTESPRPADLRARSRPHQIDRDPRRVHDRPESEPGVRDGCPSEPGGSVRKSGVLPGLRSALARDVRGRRHRRRAGRFPRSVPRTTLISRSRFDTASSGPPPSSGPAAGVLRSTI